MMNTLISKRTPVGLTDVTVKCLCPYCSNKMMISKDVLGLNKVVYKNYICSLCKQPFLVKIQVSFTVESLGVEGFGETKVENGTNPDINLDEEFVSRGISTTNIKKPYTTCTSSDDTDKEKNNDES